MSDQPRRKLKPVAESGYEVVDGPDAGYEVVEPPPTAGKPAAPPKLAIAKRATRPADPRPDDEDDEDDDRPVRRKRPAAKPHWFFRYVVNARGLIALGVLVGVLAIGGLLVAVSGALSEPTKPTGRTTSQQVSPPIPKPPTAAPAAVSRPTPAGWVRFTTLDGSVTADLPELPKPITDPRLRKPDADIRIWKTDIGGVDYLINVVIPTGADGPPAGPIEQQLKDMARGFVNSAGLGQPVSQTACTVDGHPGRQLHFQGPLGSAVFRLTLVGRVAYTFGTTCPLPRMPADAKEATDFLDSVKLGPPPAPSAAPPPAATTPPTQPNNPMKGLTP